MIINYHVNGQSRRMIAHDGNEIANLIKIAGERPDELSFIFKGLSFHFTWNEGMIGDLTGGKYYWTIHDADKAGKECGPELESNDGYIDNIKGIVEEAVKKYRK